jgi:hypothetical protein
MTSAELICGLGTGFDTRLGLWVRLANELLGKMTLSGTGLGLESNPPEP